MDIVEWGRNYRWVRLLCPDDTWPRIIDVRVDGLGRVIVQGHVENLLLTQAVVHGLANAHDERFIDPYVAPDLGWEIVGLSVPCVEHRFAEGVGVDLVTEDGKHRLSFPVARQKRMGLLSSDRQAHRTTYLMCTADDKIPFQYSTWRSAECVIGPAETGPLNVLLEPQLAYSISPGLYDTLYTCGTNPDVSTWPELGALHEYTYRVLEQCMRRGEDLGNVTQLDAGSEVPRERGMNRLNHCPAIFEEAYRSGDDGLREVAVLWCLNNYQKSIWWAPGKYFGGTLYPHDGRRKSPSFDFCTKGYDSFFYAYEETGDPRFSAALRWQVEYARKNVSARFRSRNVGDVLDFVRLYEFTGCPDYLAEARRLWKDLRGRLQQGNLFTEEGDKPIDHNPPFIDDDDYDGMTRGTFVKPYIAGYALLGLPRLYRVSPQEAGLFEVIEAVSLFLAQTQDPLGGWRYPHPRSSTITASNAIEHAVQLKRAAEILTEKGADISVQLSAIERVLQLYLASHMRTGSLLTAVQGWERSTGALREEQRLSDIYRSPQDRDASKDYTQGAIDWGSVRPDSLVYLSEVLDFYLRYRPAERLFNRSPQLSQILARLPDSAGSTVAAVHANHVPSGLEGLWPAFYCSARQRMDFNMSWAHKSADMEFPCWRRRARQRYLGSLFRTPERVAFNMQVIDREDRDSYQARKIMLNINSDCRVAAYLLVPTQTGPHPAIIALHDHGAHFRIGKEKVVRPFAESPMLVSDAQGWVEQAYDGYYIGDEFARRGYVVFAMDVIPWGQRGSRAIDFDNDWLNRSTLSLNMNQLGYTWAGFNVWDDIRSAEFVQSLAEVDPARIGCVGLSMGGNRAWHLAAATDIVSAGAAICWMADTESLARAEVKYTIDYSMMHFGMQNFLDYPDVASIACPKPMLFFNGAEDGLFPVAGVERCYRKLKEVWASQHAEDNLVCKLWNVPHVFSRDMQHEVFLWFDKHFQGPTQPSTRTGEQSL